MLYFDSKISRWVVDIDRLIVLDGKKERVRKTKRLPAGTAKIEAERIADAMEAKIFQRAQTIKAKGSWNDYVDGLLEDNQSWIYKTLASCKHRADSLGRQFSLSPKKLAQLLRDTGGRCEVTGIEFSEDKTVDGARQRPFIHSIDRIDSSKGYTEENIRIVCFAVNMAMSNWGEKVFSDLAVGYVFNKFGAFNKAIESI